MNDDVLAFVVGLADELPGYDMDQLAEAAESDPSTLHELRARTGSPAVRQACDRLSAALRSGTSPGWLSGALRAAKVAIQRTSARQSIEVVWTGPESDVDTSRLTAPVVVGLIEEADRELLVVSFATNEEPRISAALQSAAARGVDVTLLLERPQDNPSFTGVDNAFPEVRARRLAWPSSSRDPGTSLHAKVLVVDHSAALVTSANMTGRGIEDNLECGIVIRGGPQPVAIRDHIWSLYRRGRLERV